VGRLQCIGRRHIGGCDRRRAACWREIEKVVKSRSGLQLASSEHVGLFGRSLIVDQAQGCNWWFSTAFFVPAQRAEEQRGQEASLVIDLLSHNIEWLVRFSQPHNELLVPSTYVSRAGLVRANQNRYHFL